MHETNNVCLYAGVSDMFVTLVQWVMTFPKCTGGAPLVLLALLLGAGDCSGGDSIGLDALDVSVVYRGLRDVLADMWVY